MKRLIFSLVAAIYAATVFATNYTVFDIANAGEWGGNAEGWGQTVKFGDKSFKVTSVKAGSSVDPVAPNRDIYSWRVYKSSEINIESTGTSMKQITFTYDNYAESRYCLEMTLSEGWSGTLKENIYSLTGSGLNKLTATPSHGQVRITKIVVSDQTDDTSEAVIPTAQEPINGDENTFDPSVLEIDGVEYRINENDPASLTIITLPKIEGDTLVVPDRVEYNSNTYIVSGIDWGYRVPNVSHAVIPNTIKFIGDFAFESAENLKTITFGNNVERIGVNAFARTGLEYVTLPNSVKEIGSGAFYDSNLKSITLGSNVNIIGTWCFGQCNSIDEIICYAEEPPHCDMSSFYQVNQEIRIEVPIQSFDIYHSDSVWSRFNNITGSMHDKVVLDKSVMQIYSGRTEQLTVVKGTGNISWASSNPDCVTVQDGAITGVSVGSSIITATDETGAQASCNVYVYIPITDVIVDKKDIRIYKGETSEAYAYVLPENADTKFVWWESKDPNIVELETDLCGKVTIKGLNIGRTTVTAKSWDGVSADIEVEVMVPVVRLKIEGVSETSFAVTAIKDGECVIEVIPQPSWEVYSVSFNGSDITDRIKDNSLDISGIDEDGCLNFVLRQIQTGINEKQPDTQIHVDGNMLTVNNLSTNSDLLIYSLDGMLINAINPKSPIIKINLESGIYIIKHDNEVYRVII